MTDPTEATLAARRFALESGPPVDPYSLAGDHGILYGDGDQLLVGLGCALAIPLPSGLGSPADLAHVTTVLASIECDDRLGADSDGPAELAAALPGPVLAFGALPFDRDAPTTLIVPEYVFGRATDGREWLTAVSSDPEALPTSAVGLRKELLDRVDGRTGRSASSRPNRLVSIVPDCADDDFKTQVADAVTAIEDGELVKVVLARRAEVTMAEPVDVADLMRRWHRLEPTCTIFSLPTPDGRFVGASPELLVDRRGSEVRSRPLAGTTGRIDGPAAAARPSTAALLESGKDGVEHRLVVEFIAEALAPLCDQLDVPPCPHLVHLHNMTHLGTSIAGTLRSAANGRPPSALELVAALHPTPAVGGVPRGAALEAIGRLEPRPRGPYAGPVGYVDAGGDGTWVLGIRSLSVERRTAVLSAGVGIVAGSDPEAELLETMLKFDAAFSALAPGAAFSTSSGARARAATC